MTDLEANKALVRRYVTEIWNRGDASRAIEFVSDDVKVHAPPFPDDTGIDALTGISAAFRAALPDLAVEIDMVAAGDDRVMHHYVLSGTHTGAALFGADASGRKLATSGIMMFRISDSRIASAEGLLDGPGLMQQLHPAR